MPDVIKKAKIGRVVSDKMQKTRVVEIQWKQAHPKYKRLVGKATRLKMHDEKEQSRLGDLVRLVESRPISKEKRWRLAEILQKGQVAELKPQEIEETTLAELAAKQRPTPAQAEVAAVETGASATAPAVEAKASPTPKQGRSRNRT